MKRRLITKRETYKRDNEIEGGREVSGGEEERHPNGDRRGKKTSDLPHLLHGDRAIDRSLALFGVRLSAPALATASLRQRGVEFESKLTPKRTWGLNMYLALYTTYYTGFTYIVYLCI